MQIILLTKETTQNQVIVIKTKEHLLHFNKTSQSEGTMPTDE